MTHSPYVSRSVSEDRLDIVFSATMENIDRACQDAMAFLKARPMAVTLGLFAVHLGIREGLTNAVRHGNRFNASKTVSFSVILSSSGSLEIRIQDQGEGFDWRNRSVAVPDDGSENGRGFAILEAYFTRVRFNEAGNLLTLVMEPQPSL